MKTFLALLIGILGTTASFADDVCVLEKKVYNWASVYPDYNVSFKVGCTISEHSFVVTDPGLSDEATQASVIKRIISNGYKPATDHIFIKP
jgi:hypothetical protein